MERCSNDFFKVVAPKLDSIGAGDFYFNVHIEADEHHGIMGLEYIPVHDPDAFRGRQLITKALEGIRLWAAMLHSWIDVDIHPKFDIHGNLVSFTSLAG